MARKQYKLDKRDRLTSEPPFTPDTLRRLIGDTLGNRYAPPTQADAERLCRILNGWHAWFYEAQELREFNAAADEAAAAIEVLRRTLPVIGNHHSANAERGDQFARWMYEAASELYQAVGKDPARVTHRDSVPDQVRDWRWVAQVAPAIIRDAVRPANPGFSAGYTAKELLDILAAVIPQITGETVTATAIKNQLILLRNPEGDGDPG